MSTAQATMTGATDAPAVAEDVKPGRPALVSYLDSCTQPQINADGLLVVVPEVGEHDFNRSLHKAPTKAEFVNEHDYLRFKAGVAEAKAADLMVSAEKFRTQAGVIEEYGDPATRKKIQKLKRLEEQRAAIMAELIDDGVSIPSA